MELEFRHIVRGRARLEPSDIHSRAHAFKPLHGVIPEKGAEWFGCYPLAWEESPATAAQGSCHLQCPIPLTPPTGAGVLPGKMAWIPRLREHLGATAESEVCAHSQTVP